MIIRVAKLTDLVGTAEREAYQGIASSVFNQAALLASDIGLPGLARQWCHRHAAAYLTTAPHTGMDAIRGLEPLVNLARLHIRAGHGDQGHHLLLALYEAVGSSTAVTLDGITVPGKLTTTEADHRAVHQWLWRVLVADATRALTTAGRWDDALGHLQRHHGVGKHMLDGRQVAVLARATSGDYEGARELIAATAPGEPWENVVTACLTALCRPTDSEPSGDEINTLLTCCRELEVQADLVVFHTRLALSVIDAVRYNTLPGVENWASNLVDQVIHIRDGYAARDLLALEEARANLLTDAQVHELSHTVSACALGQHAIPDPLMKNLEAILTRSETLIHSTLRSPSRPGGEASATAS